MIRNFLYDKVMIYDYLLPEKVMIRFERRGQGAHRYNIINITLIEVFFLKRHNVLSDKI